MSNFQVGDMVTWKSQAGGRSKTKTGEVIAIVPAGKEWHKCVPEDTRIKPFNGSSWGIPRRHESYLVLVDGKLYWPRVVLLQEVGKAQPMSEWKLVADELPPIDEVVLLFYDDDYAHIGARIGTNADCEGVWAYLNWGMYPCNGKWKAGEVDPDEYLHPIRWCRIPLPPEVNHE